LLEKIDLFFLSGGPWGVGQVAENGPISTVDAEVYLEIGTKIYDHLNSLR
jgi:hypothetical protein